MTTDVDKKKQSLRTQHRQQRRDLEAAARSEEQALLDAQLENICNKWDGPIAAYMAMSDECSCQHLINVCFAQKRVLYVPKVAAPHRLTWHIVQSVEELAVGAYGIQEPTTEAQRLPEDILLLCPGLAFNAAGQRLGMGGGFYDNVLSTLSTAACSIGLAWSCQIENEIPVEAHDANVDAVLVADRWISPKPNWL